MTWKRNLRSLAIHVLVGTLALLEGTARAHEPLPAFTEQPLAGALESIARQAGLQLIYSSFLSNGVMTRGAPAGLSWQQALASILRDTGLTYQLVNPHTVTIIRDPRMASEQDVPAHADRKPRRGSRSASSRIHSPFDLSSGEFSLEQIVITGSHIPGATSGGRVITISRREIDRSGYSTTQDVIRALPQNFGGGPSEDTRTSYDDALNNSRATGLNLRGLGAGSTLVLLNGRRLAASGSNGRFVDVSAIPLSAIERIEILPDGASAIYGADAVGGVVNFILRDDYEGAESQLKFGSVTQGATTETQLAQLFGTHWNTGNALLTIEYYTRDNLPNSARRQTADSDLRALGGDNFDTTQSNPGTIVGLSQTWAIPQDQDGRSLTAADFTAGTANFYNRNEGWDLLPSHKRWSMVGTARQDINERANVFLDTLVSQRRTDYLNPPARQTLSVPNTNPFYVDPSGLSSSAVSVLYNFMNDLGPERDHGEVTTISATLGSSMRLGDSWQVTAYGGYSLAKDLSGAVGAVNQTELAKALADGNPETAFNPFGDGSVNNPATIERIRDEVWGRSNAGLQALTLTAAGTLVHLADRDIQMAVGADYRRQTLNSFFRQGDVVYTDREFGRHVSAEYAELLVPLTPKDKTYPGLQSAQLSLALRHERYSDFGSATMPKVGLQWSPVPHLAFRGSWSRSLKAPSLADQDESHNALIPDLQVDPSAPNAVSLVLLRTGGNRQLQDENAETWTAGAEIEVPSRHLAFSAGYFDITYKDQIDRVTYSTAFLADGTYADIVTRNPSAELLQDVCAHGGLFIGNSADCPNLQVAAVVDMRLNNISVLNTKGVDLLATHEQQTSMGIFVSQLNATRLLRYARAQLRTSPLLELLDTPSHPVDFRLRSTLSWDFGSVGLSLFGNYVDGYEDTVSTPHRSIGSWTTFDVQARYGASRSDPRRFYGTTLAFNVQNVFDSDPPFYNNPDGFGYDPSNADLLGRFVSFQLRKSW